MFNLWSFKGIGAVVSSGLGGGSLIYANVLLRKPTRSGSSRRTSPTAATSTGP